MQPLTRIRGRFQGADGTRAGQIARGAIVYGVLVVVAAVIGILYVLPPGQRTLVFNITDAATIKIGNDVRVAGVSVGKVSNVRLRSNWIRVEATIDRGVRIGDQSTVDIRLLTAAGGNYVNLTSAGGMPLGDAEIPVERTRPPYLLPELLSEAADTVKEIDAAELGRTLDNLASGLEANPATLSTTTKTILAVAEIADQQQQQIRTTLNATTEILRTLNLNKAAVGELIRKAAIFMSLLDQYKVELNVAMVPLVTFLRSVIEGFGYIGDNMDWLNDVMQRTDNALQAINTDIPRIISNFGNLLNNVRAAISPGSLRAVAPDNLLASDVCVPAEGRTC